MDGGADVVDHTRQRQLLGAGAAAGRGAASSTVTSHPAAASVIAATSPLGPAPTTTASSEPVERHLGLVPVVSGIVPFRPGRPGTQ